ncbi:MAG TPA: PD-(D/E)XK nuclease family protein [Phycisphaerae bacterium]|nr:PD-(D/E)XK nuclease family protein [Phycisphaerae bacterium]HRR87115.1 PD-(D/E)XK nuclease family protein [Phycisphaerae bacterium]
MSAADEELVFSSVSERDVDFMLVEEFRCSIAFSQWFAGRILPPDEQEHVRRLELPKVLHSVRANGPGGGESDIVLMFGPSAQTKLLVLVENKIDAVFQEAQAQRYQTRAREAVARHEAERAICVLVAPNEYVETSDDASHFDAIVTYEEISEFFNEQVSAGDAEYARRQQHRRYLIDCAIGRYRRGYAPVPSPETTRIWEIYYQRACAIAPGLKMRQPGCKPAYSSFIRFGEAIAQHPGLPRMVIKHKLCYGNVDLELPGWASCSGLVTPVLEPALEPGMKLRLAGKSLAVNIIVPVFNMDAEPGDQIKKFDLGLEAALRLQSWCEQHLPILRRCAALIDQKAQGMQNEE